jgi:ABC-type transporter Mla maintaining outer membrane lipid asymmetry ATPase subunit MlaF
MAGPPVVELEGVDVPHAAAPDVILLEAVDWRVGPGEVHLVAGEQGSGRTALLLTAAGLAPPAAGTVRHFGHDLARASELELAGCRRRIGFVFEHGGRLLSHVSVVDNVALPLRYHLGLDAAAARGRAAQLLAAHGLGALGDAMPSRLSVRLQQRASLVRALALPRDVVFLDNPLAGTTARAAAWWRDALSAARAARARDGGTLAVVATCDDLGPWLDIGTDFALIQDRRLRRLGGREAVAASRDTALHEFLAPSRWLSRT